jgi:2-oxoglutarate dehydrogenase complex dihydrolipoamide succinyltransferase (E2) component
MKYDMVMPKMGESITEGTIIKWLKNVGDSVDKDEIILEISTDKVDSEIPTPTAGKLVEVLANDGDTVEVGTVIAKIETEKAEDMPETSKTEEPAGAEDVENEAKEEKISSPPLEKIKSTPAAAQKSSKFFSPVVLNIARTEGISTGELEKIEGSGINGRVTKKDVLQYLEKKKSGAPNMEAASVLQPQAPPSSGGIASDGVESIPMDHIRKKIAEHMVQTVHTSPHVGLFIEADMSNVVAIRERNKNTFFKKEGIKLTYMPFIAEAVSKTLKEFPYVNASLDGDNILIKHFINLGIAVATDQGLIVPVIKNSDALNLVGFARAINDLATRARNRKLKPDEVTGGTFSLSNFGIYGTSIGFPLINQPQVAILGIGALEKRAVVVHDAIAIRPMMNVSLSFDHRLIDGALGAQFLERLREHLQNYDPNLSL